MTSTPRHRDLPDWIRDMLQAPIPMDDDLLDHLEAVVGTRNPSELLTDLESSTSASFLDLLCHPDRRARLQYERCWGEIPFSDVQAAAVVDDLLGSPVTATLRMDSVPHTVKLPMPDFALAAFVERLKITWRAPDRLVMALKRLEDPHRIEVRAALRHFRAAWHDGRIESIERLLTCLPAAAHDFHACLAFLLGVLPELGPAEDFFEFLMAQKRFFFQSLCRLEAFEARRRNSNMEILIMQGERFAHGDIEQWRTGMRLVDRIAVSVCGRTCFFQRPVETSWASADDMMPTLFRDSFE